MSYCFDHDDEAWKNFTKYFLHQSYEQKEHTKKLMKLQNQSNSSTFLRDIKKPDQEDWENVLTDGARTTPEQSESITTGAAQTGPHLCDFLETHYIGEQVKGIKLGDQVTNLCKMGAPESGMAEYLFDKHILGHSNNES